MQMRMGKARAIEMNIEKIKLYVYSSIVIIYYIIYYKRDESESYTSTYYN